MILEFVPDQKIHRIRAVFQGSPAARAKVQPGEEIVSVNGEPTLKMSFEELGKKIRGSSGEAIRLTLKTPSTGLTREVSLNRVSQQTVSPLIMGAPDASSSPPKIPSPILTDEEKAQVKAIIQKLKTPEEMKKMEGLLKDLKEGRLIKPDFFKILKVEFKG